MKDIYKCAYKYCKLGGMVKLEESIIENKKHYHKECLQDKQNRQQIKQIFIDKINPSETISVLVRVINSIIDTKQVSSDFLLFALNYVICNKLPLNHAQGLYYIINNDKIKTEYKRKQYNKFTFDIDKIKTNEEVKFKYKSDKSSWNDIFRK